jgi:hypothetical protein
VANQQQPGDSAARLAPLSPTGAARRRFARAGATASGVLLTLQSAPAMAQVICTAPSGSLSNGPTSTQPGVGTATCQGVQPSGWASTTKTWPGNFTKNTRFGDMYTCGGTLANTKLIDLLTKVNASPDINEVAKYMIAAKLNVLALKSSFQNVGMLNTIWAEFLKNNSYVPMAGVAAWDAAKLVDYFNRTMPNAT